MTGREIQNARKVVRQPDAVIGENVRSFAQDELNIARALLGVVCAEELDLGGEHRADDLLDVRRAGDSQLLPVINADGVACGYQVRSGAADDGGLDLLSGHGVECAVSATLEQAA